MHNESKKDLRKVIENTPITKNNADTLGKLSAALESIEKEEWKVARQNIKAVQSIISEADHGRI